MQQKYIYTSLPLEEIYAKLVVSKNKPDSQVELERQHPLEFRLNHKNVFHFADFFGHFIKMAFLNKPIISDNKRSKKIKFKENKHILDAGHPFVLFQICAFLFLPLSASISINKLQIAN